LILPAAVSGNQPDPRGHEIVVEDERRIVAFSLDEFEADLVDE
jgi:hypothetical protein